MSSNFETWFNTAPPEVKDRYEYLYGDLSALKKDGYLPQSPGKIVDAGSGSGAGTMALKELYPEAKVTGIDNKSTQQNELQYKVKYTLMGGVVQLYADVCDPAFSFEQNDLVLASRFPVIWSPGRKSEREHNIVIARRILALTKLVAPYGFLAFAYDSDEDPGYLDEIIRLFELEKLFLSNEQFGKHDYGDEWLVLSQPTGDQLPAEELLR